MFSLAILHNVSVLRLFVEVAERGVDHLLNLLATRAGDTQIFLLELVVKFLCQTGANFIFTGEVQVHSTFCDSGEFRDSRDTDILPPFGGKAVQGRCTKRLFSQFPLFFIHSVICLFRYSSGEFLRLCSQWYDRQSYGHPLKIGGNPFLATRIAKLASWCGSGATTLS